ncbi:MAG: transglutaminase domain-containing protein, partial [Micromonosporaceae bacterium]
FPADRRLPAEYTVTSTVTTATESELESATPAPLPGGAALDTRAAPPPELAGKASTITEGAYGYPALRRLAEFFSAGEFATDISTNPPAGHGLYQIQGLFERKIGTAEQYASAYAVLARALGYHARVVVGFIPGESDSGVYPVSGRDVHAWVEVEFADLGWVPIDPTPGRTGRGGEPDSSPEPRDSPTPSKTPSPDVPATPATTPRDSAGGGLAAAAGDTALPVALLLAGMLVLGAIAVPVVKSGRRRRRRTGADSGRRTLAAWRDTVEALAESGVPMARSDTTFDVVTVAWRRYGPPVGEPMRKLARLRDQAAYGTDRLPLSAGDTAWLHADLARRSISRSLPALRRCLAFLDPRPLLRGHR